MNVTEKHVAENKARIDKNIQNYLIKKEERAKERLQAKH